MITLAEIQATGLPLEAHDEIAAALSAGRTKIVPTEIGKGRVIATIGLESANDLLDVIDTAPDFRHVKQLLASGWLDVGAPLTRGALDNLAAGGVVTQAEADAIKALAEVPDPVTPLEVALTIERG